MLCGQKWCSKNLLAYTVFFKRTASPHGLYNSSSSLLSPICSSSAIIFLEWSSFCSLSPPSVRRARCWGTLPRAPPCDRSAPLVCCCWLPPAYKQHPFIYPSIQWILLLIRSNGSSSSVPTNWFVRKNSRSLPGLSRTFLKDKFWAEIGMPLL